MTPESWGRRAGSSQEYTLARPIRAFVVLLGGLAFANRTAEQPSDVGSGATTQSNSREQK
jgi:hypothetical protein